MKLDKHTLERTRNTLDEFHSSKNFGYATSAYDYCMKTRLNCIIQNISSSDLNYNKIERIFYYR